MANENFGPHYMLDIYNADVMVLGDYNRLYKMLIDLPLIIGMKSLTSPYIVLAESNGKPTTK